MVDSSRPEPQLWRMTARSHPWKSPPPLRQWYWFLRLAARLSVVKTRFRTASCRPTSLPYIQLLQSHSGKEPRLGAGAAADGPRVSRALRPVAVVVRD